MSAARGVCATCLVWLEPWEGLEHNILLLHY